MALASYPNLAGADYAVALAIAKHLNSFTGEAWPSIKTLADLTNREESTVWRSIERLERLQLLEVNRGRGRTRSNRYRPLLGAIDCDPKTLRPRRKNTAGWKIKLCSSAVRTLDEV